MDLAHNKSSGQVEGQTLKVPRGSRSAKHWTTHVIPWRINWCQGGSGAGAVQYWCHAGAMQGRCRCRGDAVCPPIHNVEGVGKQRDQAPPGRQPPAMRARQRLGVRPAAHRRLSGQALTARILSSQPKYALHDARCGGLPHGGVQGWDIN